MSIAEQVFLKCLNLFYQSEKISAYGSNCLFVFQGFTTDFYQALNSCNVQYLFGVCHRQYPDVSIRALDRKFLVTSLCNASGYCWCFYEDFIELAMILKDFSIYAVNIVIVKNDLFEDDYYPIAIQDKKEILIRAIESEIANQENDLILNYYSDYKVEGDYLLISFVNKHYDFNIENYKIYELGFFDVVAGAFIVEAPSEDEDGIALSSLPEMKCKLLNGELSDASYCLKADNSKGIREQLRKINMIGKFYNVKFYLAGLSKRNNENKENQYISILKKYWGENASFRCSPFYCELGWSNKTVDISQGTIISDVIRQSDIALSGGEHHYSDIIVTAPTGSGKSLFFQIPGIYLHECHKEAPLVTIVVCPLVALMADQVRELQSRKVHYATYINSSITYQERQQRLQGIKDGTYSIVYLSPELLLAYDLSALIGKRKIGLMVIDEAHLVTSWGRDFRINYWLLGDYIKKIRKSSYYPQIPFPVLCLTATAVCGGRDDVIGSLQSSLQLTCYSEHMYIGYVRRNNIKFDIRHPFKEKKTDQEAKIQWTAKSIVDYINKDEKTIVYFPFIRQIDEVESELSTEHKEIYSKIERYHSGLENDQKYDAYNKFCGNKSLIMMATKAFGMGVNIGDIKNVYHFAPTGNLADYVQEIGRAARTLDVGYAITDYLPSDMRYAQTLWGLSGLRHYQIQAIAKKLYDLYKKKGHRNLLFSPETFNYLFDKQSVDMKIKSGLMLLSNDLFEKYHFKVISVRARKLFSTQYIVVPNSIEKAFLAKYGSYCKLMEDNCPQKEFSTSGKLKSTITKAGNVFEIDLAQLWENEFVNFTFADFKRRFFRNELFLELQVDGKNNIVPNYKLVISYNRDNEGYDKVVQLFKVLVQAIHDSFCDISKGFGGKEFSFKIFFDTFKNRYKKEVSQEYVKMLLDLFCYDDVNPFYQQHLHEPWKCVRRKRNNSENVNDGERYCIQAKNYAYTQPCLLTFLRQVAPNAPESEKYVAYVTVANQDATYQQLMASLLQLFDMASYEFIGGKNPQIFVRINDPEKLRKIACINQNYKYKNGILADIEERHKRAVKMMNRFMAGNFTSEQRWDIIERYFLGEDDIDFEENFLNSNKFGGLNFISTEAQNSATQVIELDKGDVMTEYYKNWNDAIDLPQCKLFAQEAIPLAKYANSKLCVNDKPVDCMYVWPDAKVAILEKIVSPQQMEMLQLNGWLCFQYEDIDILAIKQRLCV
ncbi:helicase-related protein [Fretibacterium sp. OH1220_COT-178]|uniref:helicase-related protein n=1 Tax=Fretibacterium sp. OH1220_COT-178 TaxID=2491047 RepID=UPI000F5E14B4|nr:helicase-related protein [Fretibacterium sp. OH1220_COT-178]RRD63900.1 ATP-dependent DNA helicase RecQ [Fretibacterium sp. OH1220_COT-178]